MDHMQLVAELQKLLEQVLKDNPVAAAYLYGSAARGEMTPLSDVDIGLLSQYPVSLLGQLDLELSVEVELASLGYERSDVRVINDAPIALRGELLTEGLLLYSADEPRRVDFETRARREYFDFLPHLEYSRQYCWRRFSEELDRLGQRRG